MSSRPASVISSGAIFYIYGELKADIINCVHSKISASNMKIERVLFHFKIGNESLNETNLDFFEIGYLLTRLLNNYYVGKKKLKFVNIYFCTEETFELFPLAPKGGYHFGGGDLTCYLLFDYELFKSCTDLEKIKYVWKAGCEIFREFALDKKNKELAEAIDLGYAQGFNINFNPDYQVVQDTINVFDRELDASIWIAFEKDAMYSKLVIEYKGTVIFRADLESASRGNEFFFVMYKGIVVKDDKIVIKAQREADPATLKFRLKDLAINWEEL